MLVSGKMAITPLWKELGEEVIPFSKTTGSELSDEHKNFMIPSKNDWENCVWSWQPYLQKKEKKEWKCFILDTLYLSNSQCFNKYHNNIS